MPAQLKTSDPYAIAHVKTGDILAIRGTSWLSRGIIKAQLREYPVEPAITVSHVALITTDAPFPVAIEALHRVLTRDAVDSIADAEAAWIFKDTTLTDAERAAILRNALKFSAAGYNWPDIVLQLTDSVFHTTWPTDHLTWNLKHMPICSYVVADSYSKVHRNFGQSDRTTTPQNIACFALGHQDKYTISKVK